MAFSPFTTRFSIIQKMNALWDKHGDVTEVRRTPSSTPQSVYKDV
jgi:hypothetical protein